MSKDKWEGTQEEWEDLCDRCGKCCEIKEFKGPLIKGTGVACPLLGKGRCLAYGVRRVFVPSCLKVTPENVLDIGLPSSCAYVRWARDIKPWKLEYQRENLVPFREFMNG